MAKTKTGSVLDGIQGRVGNVVFRRWGESYVVSARPRRSQRQPTAGQLAHRERFRHARDYARQALTDPDVKALYAVRARERRCSPYAIAVGDFFNAPSVDEIDLSAYHDISLAPITRRSSSSTMSWSNCSLRRCATHCILEAQHPS